MKLLRKRKALSIRFASVCLSIMVFVTSAMVYFIYPDDKTTEVDSTLTRVYEVEEDGSNDETIAIETLVETINSTNETECTTDESLYNIELDHDVIEYKNDEEVVQYTDDKVDISVLQSPEYLPVYKYGERITPTIDIPIIDSSTDIRNYKDDVDTSEYLYIGTYSITGYTPKCYHCCGNTSGITASGVEAIAGYTVAADKSIPFGTTLYIEGYGFYIVEDRGHLGKNVIDIAAPDHESCYDLTDTGINVYVVPQI